MNNKREPIQELIEYLKEKKGRGETGEAEPQKGTTVTDLLNEHDPHNLLGIHEEED